MTRRLLVPLLFTCFLFFAFKVSETIDTYAGYAYSEGTQLLLYKEEFTDRFENGKLKETIIRYRDTAGKIVATRTMDFSHSDYAPDFKTDDTRNGYLEGAEIKGDEVRLFVRKDKNSVLQEKLIHVPQPIVIDGGFNSYIKAHWNELMKGNDVVFHFTVSSSLDYFTLRARKTTASLKEVVIRIEPDKAILRWIVPPFFIHYDPTTKRVLSYEGRSYISDEKGITTKIKLVYPDKGP